MQLEGNDKELANDTESRCLPSSDEQVDTSSQTMKVRPTRPCIMVFTVVLSLIAIISATVLLLMGRKEGTQNPKAKLERLQDLQSTLLNFSDSLTFVRPDSPQSQALQYLAFKQDYFDVKSKDKVAQLYALLVLLFACGGYTDLLDDNTFNECDISFLRCDEAGNLVSADFRNQKLSGRIPRELGLLTQLEELDMRFNDIEGTIPAGSLVGLTNLGMFICKRGIQYAVLIIIKLMSFKEFSGSTQIGLAPRSAQK